MRVPPCIAIVGGFVARVGCACCDCAASAWSVPFAHLYKTGRMRGVHLRGHTNILKRLLIHIRGFTLALLMGQLIGLGTARVLQGRLNAALATLQMLMRLLQESVV
jgi:hypothetical protein